MNTPLLGKDLNKRYRVNDDILTPDEIVAVGLTYVPSFPYVTEDGETIEKKLRKSMICFDHERSEEEKLKIKEIIVRELKYRNCSFVNKVFILPFADDMDYSGFSFDVRIVVLYGQKKSEVGVFNESINMKYDTPDPKIIEQLRGVKKIVGMWENMYDQMFQVKI